MATTNLNVVTASNLDEALTQIWTAMQTWVTTNIDNSNIMGVIKQYLDEANRQVIGTTATAKAQALVQAVDSMVAAFTAAGVDTTNVPTASFAQLISSIAAQTGVWIKDTDGVLWTAASWTNAKEQGGGVDPATPAGIWIQAENNSFFVASVNYGTCQFGTYGHNMANLQSMSGGSAGTPYSGELNARRILAQTNPDQLKAIGWTIDYSASMTVEDVRNADLVFFPNESTLTTWANSVGLANMVSLGAAKIYAIPHTDTGYYVLKYFSGTTSIAFANREAKAPYTDNYGQIGCTAMTYAISHTEYTGDPKFWRVASIYELLVIYLNKTAINQCRTALEKSALPSAQAWSVIQYNNLNEYSFNLADGSYANPGKTNNCWVVPVASSLKPTASNA